MAYAAGISDGVKASESFNGFLDVAREARIFNGDELAIGDY